MNIRTFSSEIIVAAPRADIFAFFSNAGNLNLLTPSALKFRILTPQPITMGAGAIIDYTLNIHGFPVRWQTEITAWQPPERFVDVQNKGPYKLWRHTHSFEEIDERTTRISDTVEYATPGWLFEPLIDRFLVRPDIEKIFRFRAEKISDIFSSAQEQTMTPTKRR